MVGCCLQRNPRGETYQPRPSKITLCAFTVRPIGSFPTLIYQTYETLHLATLSYIGLLSRESHEAKHTTVSPDSHVVPFQGTV